MPGDHSETADQSRSSSDYNCFRQMFSASCELYLPLA